MNTDIRDIHKVFKTGSLIADDLEDKSKRRTDYSDTDENGNPRLECAPLLAGHYKHMREPPIKSSNPLNDPMRFRQTSYGTNTRDLDESTSNQEVAKKHRKKQKKDKTVETVRRAEEIENYQGSKEIDEILSFIENDCTGRKPRKVPNNNTVDISSSKATDKNNKKNKERKPKVTPVDLKPTEKKDSQSENKDFTEESTENSETFNSNSEMGNSTEKISTEEIVTTDCQKNIKEQNHIIAEKCIDTDNKMEEEMMNGDVISCEEGDAIGSSIRKPMEPKMGKELINHQVEKKSLDIIDNTDEVIKDPINDTSLNNVKHNNMKNSKQKQTSPVSDNNKKDSDKTYLVKEPENLTDEEKMEVRSNIVVDSDEMEKEGDYYIFTDLDLPKPVEEEFQVVGKKKKKGGPVTAKETQSKETSAAQRVPIREERRRPQRSITPPPSSIVNSLSMEAERNKMRDLSPSSFPALGAGRQGRQSFRDGRRSSTGDVPKEILIKPQDDSDLESVKSLPASAQAVSPRLQISYAKMAASPKPNCSVSTFHSDDPEDQSNVSVDLKSAVWKGSHTERRHSIGSSPDGKDNEASSIRQKFGSQELVKLEKEENLFISSQLPSSPEKSPLGMEASRSNSFQSSSVDNSAAVDSVSNTVLNTSVTKASDSEFNEPLESYSINITAHVMAKNNGANNQVSSKSHVTKSSSCEPSKPSKLQVSSKQKGIAKRQSRSVVFLDRSEKDHKNLDIVFGFDPQLDHEELVSVSNSVSSSSLQSNVLSQTKSSESVCGDNSKEFPPIPVIHSKSVSNNSSSTNTKDFKHSPRNSKSASFPLEGKNGVKSMSTLIFSSDSKNPSRQMFSFISEDTCAPAVSDGSVISPSTPTASSSVEGCVTVIYGEECGAVLGAESKTPSGGQLKYRRETGDILGCFNRIEVTSYLIRGEC